MNLLKYLDLEKLESKTYLKDELLFIEGEKCFKIGLVKKGKLKISTTSINGEEIIFNIINQGEIFGNNLLFSLDNIYLGNVSALEDSEVIYFSKAEFISLLKSNKELLNEYLTYEAENSKKLNSMMKIISLPTIKERLINYLKFNNNQIIINSITELSHELNVSREGLSREVSLLNKENIIKYQKKVITLIKK